MLCIAPWRAAESAATSSSASMDVEFNVDDGPSAAEPTAPEADSTLPVPHHAAAKPSPVPAANVIPMPVVATSADVPSAPPAGPPAGSGFDLSPSSVAMGAFLMDGGLSCADAGVPAEEQDRLASVRLDDYLSQRIADGSRVVSKRGPPDLQRQKNGAYTYHSSAFDAVITAEGDVRFLERGAVEGVPVEELVKPAESLKTVATFDVTDAILRAAGQDPYQSEKRWFFEQTETLRNDLADKHNAKLRQVARVSLERNLHALIDNPALTAGQKHQGVFALWNDCAADEVGTEAQQLIERFVRTFMPVGSALAFSESELTTLNTLRAGKRLFAPYAG